MNTGQIIARVRRTFGDDSSNQINDSDIIGWINEAMKEIAIASSLLQTTGTAATTAGTAQYTLPTDILKLHSVKWQGYSLQHLSLEEAEKLIPDKDNTASYPTGNPTHYWTWGNQINLYPAPSSSGATDLKIFYNRNPVDVAANGDIPELPVVYHLRIVEYCLAQAHDLDDNIFGAEIKMGQFTQNLQGMAGLSEWENQDFYPFITGSPADAGEYTQGGYIYG